MPKCKVCGATFVKKRKNQVYCSIACYNFQLRKLRWDGRYKFLHEAKNLINEIRVGFDFLRTHYPDKAKRIMEQMAKEENDEFIELALDGFKYRK